MARKSKQTDVNIPGRVRTKAAQQRVGEVQSENEMFYRSIYENSPDAILLTAPDGVILEANPAACQMFGKTVEEIRRIGRSGLVDGTDPRLAIVLDERTRLGYARAEITMLRADGAKFPVEITSKLFVNAQGQQRTSMIIRDLSESKRADETQQRSEEKYRDLVENINEVLYSVSVDGMITYISPVIKAVLGYAPADLIGTHFTHLIFPEDQEKILQASGDVLRGQLYPSEYRMFTKSGEVRWVRTSSRPVRDGEQISGIQGVLTDITERKLAEEELRQSQVRESDRANELEIILNSLPTLVWIAHDPECKYISGNWAASEFLRMPLNANQSITGLVDEAPGHFKFYQDGREIPPQELPVQLAARGVVVENFEEEVVFDDGSMRYLVGNAVPLYDDQGKPRGSVGAFRDITERRHAQEMFRREKIFAENIIETAQAIILVLDMQGRIVRFNHYLEEISGYLLEEVQGKDWFPTFLPERDRDRSRQLFLKATAEIQTHGNANPIVTKDGREREIEWNDRTLKDAQGNLVGLLSIGLDITERKQAEKALHESEEKYRGLVEQSLIGIGLSRGNQVIFANPALLRIFGYDDLEEFAKIPLLDYVTPAFRDRIAARMRRAAQGEIHPADFECDFLAKDGKTKTLFASATHFTLDGEIYTQTAFQDITVAKQAEETLRENELRYRTVADNTYDWEYWVDRQGKWLYSSPSCERITGYPPGKFLEDPTFYQQIILAEDREKIETHERNTNNNQLSEVDFRIIHRDGEIRWIEHVCQEIITPEGEKLGRRASNRDITRRKRAEEALHTSEMRFSTVFHSSPLSIAITRLADNIILDVNPAWQKLAGLDHEQVIGRTPMELNVWVNPADRDRLIMKLRQQGSVEGFEIKLRKKTGAILDVTFSAVQIEVDGEPCMLSMALDITERKLAETALRESEERFRTLFQKSPIGIMLAGSDNRFIDANETLCAMLDYPMNELLKKTVLEIIHPDDRAMYTTLHGYMITGSNPGFNTQNCYLKKDGGNLWVNVTTAPVTNSAGDFAYGISIIEDITERKRAEGNLRRRIDELNLLNQISRAFNRLMPPSEILELLYKHIGLVLDNCNLYIALYDETNQSISFPIYTVNGKRRKSHNRPFGNGLTEYILRTKAPLMILHDQKSFLAEQHIDVVGVLSRSFLGAPMQVGDRVLGVIALQDYQREDAYEAGDLELISTIAGQAATALENSRLYGEIQHELNERKQTEIALREGRNRLATLSHRLVQAQEKERRRTALELHDEVGQTLTALSMTLDGITHTTREAAVRVKTARLQDMVRGLINQVSTISVELHPRDLDALGLIPGLISLFRRISTQTEIEVDFKHAGLEQMRFTSEIEISAYRIVQEALTNVIRHSGVKKVSVRLQVDGDNLWIQVQDEGQGFDLQKDVNVEDSMGLLSMMERAEQIGGRLSIETAPGEGVNITCTLPLK